MAGKTTKTNEQAPSEVEAAAENLAKVAQAESATELTGAEYDEAVKSYHEGKAKPGLAHRWVTSGGETTLRITKLG